MHTIKKVWPLVIIQPLSELAEPINRNAINTGAIVGLLILLFSFVGFNLYRVQKGKAVLVTEKEIKILAAKQWQDTLDAISSYFKRYHCSKTGDQSKIKVGSSSSPGGLSGLPRYMRRLLSGYAISYNRRHRRYGHLFQNRYKSIICEEDS